MMIGINSGNRGCLLLAALGSLLWTVVPAAAEGARSPEWGVLVMAHGGGAAWNRAVEETVAPLRNKFPIEIAFGMAKTSTLREAALRLESQGVKRVAVVRMFISGDSFLKSTEYILGLRDELAGAHKAHHADHGKGEHDAKEKPGHADHGGGHHMEAPQPIGVEMSFVLSRYGVGESPIVDEILVDRVRGLSKEPAKESVLILAHGPGDEGENERWLAHMRLRVQRLHDLGDFRHVHCETLREDWPERRKESERRIRAYVQDATRDGGRCIVVPFRVAGFGPYRDVLQGLTYVADERGFCPHPNMTKWIEATARAYMESKVLAGP